MSRVWVSAWCWVGERDGLESLCFLTKSKFAASLPIRLPNPAARVQPGESGAVRVSSRCTARTHCSANENSAHSVVGIRGCKEYFEFETSASPSSDLPANDADIDTRSHFQLFSFLLTPQPSQWPPRSPRTTPSPSAPRSVLPPGEVVVLFANRSTACPRHQVGQGRAGLPEHPEGPPQRQGEAHPHLREFLCTINGERDCVLTVVQGQHPSPPQVRARVVRGTHDRKMERGWTGRMREHSWRTMNPTAIPVMRPGNPQISSRQHLGNNGLG